MLVAESTPPAQLSQDGCSVLSGTWRDFYTGETFTDPGDLDVDHLVPLQEACESGGWDPSRDERLPYALENNPADYLSTHLDPGDPYIEPIAPPDEALVGAMWRASYANDLDDPRALIAAEAAVNRAKGGKGPEEWLPPDPSHRCRYVADWIGVKVRWRLSMDESERVAVGNILDDGRGS